jgi:hypothetical protein
LKSHWLIFQPSPGSGRAVLTKCPGGLDANSDSASTAVLACGLILCACEEILVLGRRVLIVSRQPETMRPGNDARTSVLLTTADVPEVEQLGFWREVVCRTIAGVEATPLDRKDCYAGAIQARTVPLADHPSFDLLNVKADPQRVSRTRQLISAQTEGAWLLMIQRKGTCDIRQGSAQITLVPGDIGFLDTSRPYEVIFPRRFAQSIVKLPTPLFAELFPKGRDIAGTALPGGDALAAIARYNLLLLERLASSIEPRFLPAAANRAIDHLSLAARTHFDGSMRDTRGDAYAFHFERASLYIAEHLGDTKLSVERIADAIGLSSGHLQEIFSGQFRSHDC